MEIRDIVKNPFNAKTNNREGHFLRSSSIMFIATSVIFYISIGKKIYFEKPEKPLDAFEELSSLLINTIFIFKVGEIVLISYALYLTYIGIWKRHGLNKKVKTSIMTK